MKQPPFTPAQAAHVESCLNMAWHFAWRYRSQRAPVEDLFQVAYLGLMHAARKFAPERGVKFSTYACWWVRQSVQRASQTSFVVAIPPNTVHYMHHNPGSGRGRATSKAMRCAPVGRAGQDDLLRHATAPSAPAADPFLAEGVGAALATLHQREQRIVSLRYGLDGPALTYAEIGAVMGLTKQRAQQLHERALRRLMRSPELKRLHRELIGD